MSNTSALVPYLFEGHRIRVSTDPQGEAWIVVADACAALAESPMVWAMANRRDEEHCLHSEEGPGAGGFTLALINEATLLRRLLNSDNPSAPRMRRWLTHDVLPSLNQSQRSPSRSLQACACGEPTPIPREVRRLAEELVLLTGVGQGEALAAAFAEIAGSSVASGNPFNRMADPPLAARLEMEQLAQQLGSSIRSANQRLADCGLQVRNEDDNWQLTESGLDWGLPVPANDPVVVRRQRILWHPAVVTLLRQEA